MARILYVLLACTVAWHAFAADASSLRGRGVLRADSLLSGDIIEQCKEKMAAAAAHGGVPKLDLVITWWSNMPQSDRRKSSASSLINVSSAADGNMSASEEKNVKSHTHFENQREIAYQLRSYQQHGLLSHIRDVYILVDKEVLANFGAPRGLKYDQPVEFEMPGGGTSSHVLRVVSDDTTGSSTVPDDPTGGIGGIRDAWRRYNTRLQGVHRIPGLSEFFLMSPDDNLLMKDISDDAGFVDVFFKHTGASSSLADSSSAGAGAEVSGTITPVMYTYGSVSWGDCLGQGSVGSGHGPVLGSKSVWAALDASVFRARPTSDERSYEAICVYQHTMADMFGSPFVGYSGPVEGKGVTFFTECHTNGGCTRPEDVGDSVFLNLQGGGISDEYGSKEGRVWAEWYHTKFPKPSVFETA